ncbi:DUF4435 domain-containing protein [Cycloclasticus pugetii]|uniref:DUF4435 domain-containing protein n=1 Tax=Cycloclasticus pugetii TaxID=34068 RepID=UPI003A95462B
MSRVDVLVGARSNLSVKFLEFTRIVSKGRSKYALFFEGEDEKYYAVRVNNIRPDIEWRPVNCGGKSNVISLRNKVRSHPVYCDSLCMFFVDADFDENSELTELTDVYVTPCYSIENLYVGSNSLRRILSAEFNLTDCHEDGDCYDSVIREFENILSRFVDLIIPFNALIRELRIMESNGDLEGRLNINNLKFDELIDVDISGSPSLIKKYDEERPHSIFPELAEDLSVDISSSVEHLSASSGLQWLRGKQNLEFFRTFLTQLKNDRCKKADRRIFKNRGNVKLQLTKGNCISELSQYADTPECLKLYIESQASLISA